MKIILQKHHDDAYQLQYNQHQDVLPKIESWGGTLLGRYTVLSQTEYELLVDGPPASPPRTRSKTNTPLVSPAKQPPPSTNTLRPPSPPTGTTSTVTTQQHAATQQLPVVEEDAMSGAPDPADVWDLGAEWTMRIGVVRQKGGGKKPAEKGTMVKHVHATMSLLFVIHLFFFTFTFFCALVFTGGEFQPIHLAWDAAKCGVQQAHHLHPARLQNSKKKCHQQ